MAKDLSGQMWHGLRRMEVFWQPYIDAKKCTGCNLCYVTCGRGVYERDLKNGVCIVKMPNNCAPGCSTCAALCPENAITFPPLAWKKRIRFDIVKEEAKEKEEKLKKQNDAANSGD